ncbi:Coq4 family protein [Pleurocapsa sp. PCC 7319]|uniref:Coq4 family protein n=1 Tax=Pleurocapsa sp. PCC 7319 TaxID=118161 RepID=UPI000347A000|nr:Coq4 family protein [Pleurocapsa sp. PCC 7319]
MKIDFKKLYLASKISKNSERAGDFALLKSDALGVRANPEIKAKMTLVKKYYPAINLEELSQLPLGTFGHEYALHMQKNKLKPLKISSEFSEIADSNVFALRYAVTHDIFHVLLGFDTSYAGEIGVLAFATEQNYSRSLKLGLLFAILLYPVLAPNQLKVIFANLRKGKQMARKANFLLNYRFEDYWAKPITVLRYELNLS